MGRLEDIRGFLRLSDRVGTAGQPTEEQFAAIQAAGYEVVVNLAPPTSPDALPREPEIVSALGMRYVTIPVEWTAPAVEDAVRFFDVMDANRGKNVFVHCAANMRVSAFLYLYRVLRQGMAEEDAKKDLHRIWVPHEWWQRFIETVIESQKARPARAGLPAPGTDQPPSAAPSRSCSRDPCRPCPTRT